MHNIKRAFITLAVATFVASLLAMHGGNTAVSIATAAVCAAMVLIAILS